MPYDSTSCKGGYQLIGDELMRLSEEQRFILERPDLTQTVKLLALLDLAGYTDKSYQLAVTGIAEGTYAHNIVVARRLSAAARRGTSQ